MSTRFAMITFVDEAGAPGYPSQGLPGGGYPSHGLPGAGYPSQGLPGAPAYPTGGPILPPGGALLPVFPFDPTRPDAGLPPSPGHPDAGLPPSPGHPDAGLPSAPVRPDAGLPIRPGGRFVVKYLACVGLILVPDHSLPETPEPK